MKGPAPVLGELSGCLNGKVPLAVRTLELEDEPRTIRLPPARGGERYEELVVLVREHGMPLGWTAIEPAPDGSIARETLAALHERFAPQRAINGHTPTADSERRSSRVQARELLSVVVATCDSPRSTLSCVGPLLSAENSPLEVLVVENRPGRSRVRRALESAFAGDPRVRYLEEHRRGLASARNAGLAAAHGELVAFTDDDVIADAGWIAAIRERFDELPLADCVTGLILPYELETPTQVMVERFASFGKGFHARLYSLADPPTDQPLFPYAAGHFCSGANMAFRTGALRAIGGFDPALGTGTRSRGGEDLDVCVRVLLSGRQLAYEPRAIVWHRHPDQDRRLRRQAFDYGAGLGAMLAKQILAGPERWSILAQAPSGIRYFTSPDSRKNAGRGERFPTALSMLERAGVLYGPAGYLASRLGGRR